MTEYSFTGQFSYTGSFGLLFFNARFFDPSLSRFISADSIVPPGVQGLDRYAYVNNSPLNYVDPSGHICVESDGDSDVGMAGNCGGGSNPKYKPGLQGPAWNNHQGEDDAGTSGCAYHHCQVETNLYEVGWENFGQAWDIWTSPNSTYGQKWLAGSYMSLWGGGHVAGIAGVGLYAWETIIVAGAQYFTKNPDATRVSLGNYPEYIRSTHTYFDAGKNIGGFLQNIRLLDPMNNRFMSNQIAQLKPFDVTITRVVGETTKMEMTMISQSNMYNMYTQTLSDFSGIMHVFEPWIK